MTDTERTFRAVRRTTVLVVLALSGLLLAASTGAAFGDGDQPSDDSGLAWSADGENFSSSLPAPIIDTRVRLSPGEVERSRLWVRNDTDADGQLTLVLELDSKAALRDELLSSRALVLAGQISDAAWHTVRVESTDRVVVLGDLDSGKSAPVTIRLGLSPDAPDGATLSGLDATVRVGLARAGAADGAAGMGRFLPTGGASLSALLVPLGLLLVAGGALALNRPQQFGPVGTLSERASHPARAVTVGDLDGIYDPIH